MVIGTVADAEVFFAEKGRVGRRGQARRWTLRPRMSLAFVASSSLGRAPASSMRSMARAAMFVFAARGGWRGG